MNKMPRYWISHWQSRYWNDLHDLSGASLECSGSNLWSRRQVKAGDKVYVVSIREGLLYLGGSMIVKEIAPRSRAIQITRIQDLHEGCEEWAIGVSGSPLILRRVLSPEVTRHLRFVSGETSKPILMNGGRLDPQTTRGLRELTGLSAKILDEAIRITDKFPHSDQKITVTQELLAA